MILAVTLEQFVLVLFAGGPGLAALAMQAWKHKSEEPIREANMAQTLIATGDSLMDRMQAEIDSLRAELRTAEDKIIELEAKIDAARDYAVEIAEEREKRALLELEVARLRGYASGSSDERESIANPQPVQIVGQDESVDVKVVDNGEDRQ